MMDSQEQLLNTVQTECATCNQADNAMVEEKRTYTSKEEIVSHVKALAAGEEEVKKAELDYLKSAFYRMQNAEREQAEKAYLEAGGDPMQYAVLPDPLEEEFKAAMNTIKERRGEAMRLQEEEKQNNLKRKQEILARIKELTTTPEEAAAAFDEMKQLQAEWKELKSVPAENATELWNNYKLVQEQFYDLLKMNFEAREYDFKKNLEMKTALCEAAEKLAEEEDVISAFHQLQELHNQYREIGPVAKELREEIWLRFKHASTAVNRRHAAHYEQIRLQQEENLAKKSEICDKVEMISTADCKTAADWDAKAKEIIALQAEWKTIGFAPKAMNVKIFERFRTACDQFFVAKNEFIAEMRSKIQENIARKEALVRQAQELQESTDWKQTADKMVQLQKEWKTVGMVPKKVGDALWKEFNEAQDKFFEARNAVNAGERGAQAENLAKKLDVIERLKALEAEAAEGLREKIQTLSEEFNAIGHVPFKEKDKLYEAYHEALDALYKKVNKNRADRRLNAFKQGMKEVAKRGEGAVEGELSRLQRRYDAMKAELENYETNLNFLSVSSKKGNSLIDELKRKKEKLSDELALLSQKIKAVKK